MPNSPNGQSNHASAAELRCGNCGQQLDPADKFCRECGLPTLRRAQAQRAIPSAPPDTREFKRALDTPVPEPQPFVRTVSVPEAPPEPQPDLTTGGVLKATSPTFTTQLAASTLLMVAVVIFLFGLGVLMLVLAFR
jgi:hypothetical protein